MSPLRVVFAGTPEVAVPSFHAVRASGHEVVGVLTKPDAPAGRGRKVKESAVATAAREAGLDIYAPTNLHGFDDVMRLLRADVVAVVAYGRLVPSEALSLAPLGWVNAHFSFLPAWRGAAPVQHAIAAGDSRTGVTTFRIDEGLDTGPILLRSDPVTIGPREDSGSLLARLAPIGAELLVRTLDGLSAGDIREHEQVDDGVSFAPQIHSADARIDWRRPVEEVDRWIRACTPAPGAWTTVNDERLRIGTPAAVELDREAVPGRFVVDRRVVRIGADGGYLVLGDVHPHGKRSMPADAWARGLRAELPDAR